MRSKTEDFKIDFTQLVNDVFVDGSGTVPEMLDSFTKELTDLIQKNVSGEDSDLAKTLEAHIGQDSELMNALDPKSTEGIPHIIQERIQATLNSVLDSTNTSSPISKLLVNIKEATEEGDLSRQAQIEEINQILDANNTESPIARLLREVNIAVEGSALSILKGSIEEILQNQNETIKEIYDMVLATTTKKTTADGTTLQGVDFEEEVGLSLDVIAAEMNYDNEGVGNTTGVIPNCKKGDFIITARPNSNTPSLRVVCEVKSDRSFNNVTKVVNESLKCIENRVASHLPSSCSMLHERRTHSQHSNESVTLSSFNTTRTTQLGWIVCVLLSQLQQPFTQKRAQRMKLKKKQLQVWLAVSKKEFKRYETIAKSAETIISHGTKITSQVSTAKSKVQTIIDLVNQTAAALNVESAFTDDSGRSLSDWDRLIVANGAISMSEEFIEDLFDFPGNLNPENVEQVITKAFQPA